MANKFTAGMKNVVEVLNQMWDAFAAGPYNALPLTGGRLTGQLLIGDGSLSTSAFAGTATTVNASPGTIWEAIRLGYAQTPTSFAGFWSILTSQGIGSARREGYRLSIQAYDSESAAYSSPLLSLMGTGDFAVAGSITGASVLPAFDNIYTVGSASTAYATVYARTGTINTSDARLKRDFRELTAAEIAAARDLARAIGIYRWRDAVEDKGGRAREHVGPTVQAAIEIMQAHGLDPFNYGFICHDAWERQTVEHSEVEARPAVSATDAMPEMLDESGAIVKPAVPASPGYPAIEARAAYNEITLEAGDRYAFRYDELAMFIAAGQEARMAALEAA